MGDDLAGQAQVRLGARGERWYGAILAEVAVRFISTPPGLQIVSTSPSKAASGAVASPSDEQSTDNIREVAATCG